MIQKTYVVPTLHLFLLSSSLYISVTATYGEETCWRMDASIRPLGPPNFLHFKLLETNPVIIHWGGLRAGRECFHLLPTFPLFPFLTTGVRVSASIQSRLNINFRYILSNLKGLNSDSSNFSGVLKFSENYCLSYYLKSQCEHIKSSTGGYTCIFSQQPCLTFITLCLMLYLLVSVFKEFNGNYFPTGNN